jgi:hypothetical protein
MELDGDTLGLSKVRLDIDVILCVCGWAGKEIQRALISDGLITADSKAMSRLLALVTLDLSDRGLRHNTSSTF